MEGFFWLWFIPGEYVVYLPFTHARPLTLLLTSSRLIYYCFQFHWFVGNCCWLICFYLSPYPPGGVTELLRSFAWLCNVRASFSIVRLVRFIGWLCNVALPFQLFVCSELLVECATSRFLSIARLVRSIGWLCNAAHPFQLLLSILVVHPRSCLLKQKTSPVPQYHGDLRSHPSPCPTHHWQVHFFFLADFSVSTTLCQPGWFIPRSFFFRHQKSVSKYHGGLGSRLDSIHRR